MGTRERMVDAAAHVMRSRGLAHATTKEIARAAGFSEAALYKHFASKTSLCLAVLQERTPGGLVAVLDGLAERAGERPVRDELLALAAAAVEHYTATFPMLGSVFSDPALLGAHREALRDLGSGPQVPREVVGAYLAREQELGRVAAAADPYAAADLLLGACLQHGFLRAYGVPVDGDVGALVETVLAGLAAG